jgi:cation transport ATPase
LAKAKRVAFDKTGTLTYGRPSVSMAESCAPDIDGSALLDIAAAAELRSEHPLGKAIVAHFRQERGRAPDSPDAFLLTPGRGVSAILRGREFCAGNGAFVADNGLTVPGRLAKTADGAREGGSTIIYVMEKSGSAAGITSGFASGEAADAAAGGVADVASSLASGEAADSGEPPNAAGKARVIGMIALSDTVRPDAAQTVREIRRTGAGTVLLTGDAPQAAGHIAHIAGIADVRAGCMPEDKLAAIRQYQDCGEPVCMVGDGVNDAPALKAADVGIAMGGIGSDRAIEAADIVLVGDDITEIPHLLMLATQVMRTINVNIAASMALNFAAIALAAAGVLNPVLGALVHNAGSVAVILNSSLLLKWRRKPADVKNAL